MRNKEEQKAVIPPPPNLPFRSIHPSVSKAASLYKPSLADMLSVPATADSEFPPSSSRISLFVRYRSISRSSSRGIEAGADNSENCSGTDAEAKIRTRNRGNGPDTDCDLFREKLRRWE